MKKVLAALVVLVACATVAAYPSARMAPTASLTATACLEPTDSSRIRMSWSPVMDRRGEPVAEYVGNLHRLVPNPDTVAAFRTAQTTQTVTMVCPEFGDSTVLFAEVQAVDVRGNRGAVGRSNNLVIRTFDPGPVAPTITIDTIALLDSITMAPTWAINDGASEQFCDIRVWQDGVAIAPAGCEDSELDRLRDAGLAMLVYSGR